jgi:hypothetical protein
MVSVFIGMFLKKIGPAEDIPYFSFVLTTGIKKREIPGNKGVRVQKGALSAGREVNWEGRLLFTDQLPQLTNKLIFILIHIVHKFIY